MAVNTGVRAVDVPNYSGSEAMEWFKEQVKLNPNRFWDPSKPQTDPSGLDQMNTGVPAAGGDSTGATRPSDLVRADLPVLAHMIVMRDVTEIF